MPVLNQMRAFLVRCWQFWKNLSFFYQQSTDPHEVESGRIATRIHIVLLITFLGIFNVYYSVTDVSQTISMKDPRFATYSSLVNLHPSLACPCRNIDPVYRKFIKLRPAYHQVEF
jgi:hypothetical protein